jgi:hypothetical protein
VLVAIKLPVADHESERMLGTSADGRRDSDSKIGLSGLRTPGRASFLIGRVMDRDMLGLRCEHRES